MTISWRTHPPSQPTFPHFPDFQHFPIVPSSPTIHVISYPTSGRSRATITQQSYTTTRRTEPYGTVPTTTHVQSVRASRGMCTLLSEQEQRAKKAWMLKDNQCIVISILHLEEGEGGRKEAQQKMNHVQWDQRNSRWRHSSGCNMCNQS